MSWNVHPLQLWKLWQKHFLTSQNGYALKTSFMNNCSKKEKKRIATLRFIYKAESPHLLDSTKLLSGVAM